MRKIYGKAQIRYLKCRSCQEEFSERKGTALWNVKISEEKAFAIAEHLAEGCSFKSTACLVKVDPETVRRMNRRLGHHARHFHKESGPDSSYGTARDTRPAGVSALRSEMAALPISVPLI